MRRKNRRLNELRCRASGERGREFAGFPSRAEVFLSEKETPGLLAHSAEAAP